MGLYWDERLPSYTSAASSLVLAASSGGRILHLTNHVQRTYDAFAAALDAVDLLDGAKFDSAEARQARALLSRGDGMPLRGYFIINRGVLLAILGNLLTYLIILVEFEMEDQEDDLCDCSSSTA